MPRAIRVGDLDSDQSHGLHGPDPGPNAMIENDATVWIDGASGAVAAVQVDAVTGFTGLQGPDPAAVTALITQERLAGQQVEQNEYIENQGYSYTPGGTPSTTGGSGSSTAPPIGEIAAPPNGGTGAGPDFNNYPVNESNELLNWGVPSDRTRVDPAIKTIADRMARSLGTTITVNSGYRDRNYNASVGGASSSKHMYGKAMDLAYIGSNTADRQRMLVAAIESGAQGIGLYNSFMHIDLGPKRTWNVPHPSWATSTMASAGYRT